MTTKFCVTSQTAESDDVFSVNQIRNQTFGCVNFTANMLPLQGSECFIKLVDFSYAINWFEFITAMKNCSAT